VNFYGILIALGILAAVLVIENFCQKEPFKIHHSILDIFPWLVIPGIVGARSYHVINFWQYYKSSPVEIFFVWQGGLGIFGALIGGALGLLLFVWFNKLTKKEFWNLLDLISLGLPLAQSIGRFGNFFNQELYGCPTKLPWGVFINPENRLPGYENVSRFHPLFLYESFWNLFIFVILVKTRNRFKNGRLFLIYLFLYSLGRFWLEFLRIDSWMAGRFKINQLATVLLMFLSIYFLIRLREIPRSKKTSDG